MHWLVNSTSWYKLLWTGSGCITDDETDTSGSYKTQPLVQHMEKVCLWNNGPLSPRLNTLLTQHRASGGELRHHACGIIPHFWHGIVSLLGRRHSPPPSVVGFCHAAATTSPTFVSLRCILAARQCPFLGTTHWREPHQRHQSFLSQSYPVCRRSSWTSASLRWVFLCLNLPNTQLNFSQRRYL